MTTKSVKRKTSSHDTPPFCVVRSLVIRYSYYRSGKVNDTIRALRFTQKGSLLEGEYLNVFLIRILIIYQ